MEKINYAKIFEEKAKRQQYLESKYPKDKDIDFAKYLYDFINCFNKK